MCQKHELHFGCQRWYICEYRFNKRSRQTSDGVLEFPQQNAQIKSCIVWMAPTVEALRSLRPFRWCFCASLVFEFTEAPVMAQSKHYCETCFGSSLKSDAARSSTRWVSWWIMCGWLQEIWPEWTHDEEILYVARNPYCLPVEVLLSLMLLPPRQEEVVIVVVVPIVVAAEAVAGVEVAVAMSSSLPSYSEVASSKAIGEAKSCTSARFLFASFILTFSSASRFLRCTLHAMLSRLFLICVTSSNRHVHKCMSTRTYIVLWLNWTPKKEYTYSTSVRVLLTLDQQHEGRRPRSSAAR